MADFNSNFTEIQKQIGIADLTDEQIQELMTALQTKRSAKSKLTKEEKVFYQCCRERRSFSVNQDLDTVVCPHCGSVKAIKNGTRNGRQRYLCKDCKKTFGDTNGTVAFRSKMSIGKWIEFIKLTLQGESCRTIAKELGINKYTALQNRHRVCAVLLQFVSNQDDFKSLAESDEYYYPLSFKDVKDPMFFLVRLGRMPYTHRSYWKNIKYVEKQGFDIDFLHNYIKNEEQNKVELLNYVELGDLKSQERFSNALNGMDTEKIIQVLKTFHHNISDFIYLYHGVSSKFLDYYLALFYWIEKNKDRPYLEQAYDIITLLSNQARKIPLAHFKYKPISFDLKGILG